MDKADEFLNGIEQLPPAPQILPQLLQALGDEDTDLSLVVDMISFDPALTAEVLKTCNSAFFRGSAPVDSIAEAVRRLGVQIVYRMVAAVTGARSFMSSHPGSAVNAGILWRHSVTTGFAAQCVAEDIHAEPGLLFTAGLLHDIGKVVLGLAHQAKYTRLLAEPGQIGTALVAQEKAIFGLDHAEVGSWLLARWKFSRPIVSSVRFHHQPSMLPPGNDQQVAACVHLADGLAHSLEPGNEGQINPALEPAASMAILRRTPENLAHSRERVLEHMELVESVCRLNG
jgi:putative nucleotidyltransferase with HDIG domain